MTIPDWYSSGAVATFLAFAGPSLATCLILGIAGGIVQTTTQIREAALGFVPKALGLLVVIILAGGMTLRFAGDYTRHVFQSIPAILHADDNR